MLAQRLVVCVFTVSGALAIAGALLPWLTLYAGLYAYSGMVGMYGRLIFALGILCVVTGVLALRLQWHWLPWAGAMLGIALLGFTAWLYAGLLQIVHQPESAMLVARPGPGLFVVMGASVLMMLSIFATQSRLRV